MFRRLKLEILACVTLQPERADAEQVRTSVAPLPQPSAIFDSVTPLGKASGVVDAGAALGRKIAGVGTTGDGHGLAVLYCGPGAPKEGAEADGGSGIERDVAEYICEEAKLRLGLGAAVAPVALASVTVPHCRAAVIICRAAPGADALRVAATWLEAARQDAATTAQSRKGLGFAILAVGDSASADMQPPRALRQRLLGAGAAELAPMAECTEDDLAEVMEAWAASLWQPLRGTLQMPEEGIKAAPSALYDQLGGADGLASILSSWLRTAQADWRVRRFLEGAQDAAVQAQMGQWLAGTLGGPLPYRGPDPREVHASLVKDKGLNGTHMDTLAQHLAGSLAERGVGPGVIDEVMAEMLRQRQQLA